MDLRDENLVGLPSTSESHSLHDFGPFLGPERGCLSETIHGSMHSPHKAGWYETQFVQHCWWSQHHNSSWRKICIQKCSGDI